MGLRAPHPGSPITSQTTNHTSITYKRRACAGDSDAGGDPGGRTGDTAAPLYHRASQAADAGRGHAHSGDRAQAAEARRIQSSDARSLLPRRADPSLLRGRFALRAPHRLLARVAVALDRG